MLKLSQNDINKGFQIKEKCLCVVYERITKNTIHTCGINECSNTHKSTICMVREKGHRKTDRPNIILLVQHFSPNRPSYLDR